MEIIGVLLKNIAAVAVIWFGLVVLGVVAVVAFFAIFGIELMHFFR